MKKIILLALSLLLVPAIVVIASGESIIGAVTLIAQGNSTAEWTTDKAMFGDYSAKLTMPAGTGWVNDNAEARIEISGELKLNDVTDWSFWAKGQDAYYVPIEFYIDSNEDGMYDKIIVGQKMGSMTDDWSELNQGNMSMYMAWKNGYEWLWNWSKVQEKYGDTTLLRVDIGYGSLGSNKGVTAYVDDFTLNNTTYVFEQSIPLDTTPPTITADIVVEPDIVLHGDTITVTATVTDNDSGVKAVSADFFYEAGGRPLPTSVAMYKVEGTTGQYKVEYVVPDTWSFGNMKITVAARDNSGNYIRSTDFHIVEVIPKKAEILQRNDILGKGLDKAPGLQKPFNPNSQATDNAGKKK